MSGRVTQFFGYRLSLEMLLLWLTESAICFIVLCGLINGGGALSGGTRAIGEAAILTLTIGLVSFALGLYRPESCLEINRLLVKSVVAAASLPSIWLIGRIVHFDLGGRFGWSPIWPFQMLLAWTALLLATRLLFGLGVRRDLFTHRVLLLGSGLEAARTAAAIAASPRGQFRVANTLTSIEGASMPPRKVWGVIVGANATAAMGGATLRSWQGEGLQVLTEAAFWEHHLGRIGTWSHAASVMPAGADDPTRLVSRGLDLAVAGLLLLLTTPLMLLTALAIKLDSRGPVFYRQERVGLNGRLFTLTKFRSMRNDAEANGPAWAASRDARVTRVGGFIRRMRIDELPQLLNILKGEMSVIGPRPERPHFVEQLAATIPAYRERVRVRPGLTGWAQVNFPYGASIEDARTKLSYDLYYVKHRSVFLDLAILFATVRVVLFQEGAR